MIPSQEPAYPLPEVYCNSVHPPFGSIPWLQAQSILLSLLPSCSLNPFTGFSLRLSA